MNPLDVNEVIRGFEIARWNGSTWESVAHFRPTELAVRQAATDLKWHRDRHPNDLYELRALVSIAQRGNPDGVTVEESVPVAADVVMDADVADAASAVPTLDPEEMPNG